MAATPLRSFRTLALLTALTAGLLVGLGALRGPVNQDTVAELDPSDPAVAFGLAITEQRTEWLQDFLAQGQDFRSLPRGDIEVDSWGPPMTLERARREARFVIEGRVLSTTYVSDARALGHPNSIATVQVDRVVRGKLRTGTIEVLQSGGPERTLQGSAIWQIPGDPLLFAGDHVILLLIPARSQDQRALGRYQTVYEAGIYLVTDSGVFANGTNVLAGLVSGRSADAVLAMFK